MQLSYRVWKFFPLSVVTLDTGASMDGLEAPSLYPLHRSKTIHLVGAKSVVSVWMIFDVLGIRGCCFYNICFCIFLCILTLLKFYLQVRHGQGIHNVEGDKNYKSYMSPEYFDAELTPLGWQQVRNN